jgi:predicted flavoprotein YhiN
MEEKKDLKLLISRIKKIPITLKEPRPLLEAISSSGGLSFSEVNESLELKKFPGVYVCGEMLDWDAPTGGFLIQGAVSQGAWVGLKIKLPS